MLSVAVLPFGVSIEIQIVSLPALLKKTKFGMAMAITRTVIMLPLSLIFIQL